MVPIQAVALVESRRQHPMPQELIDSSALMLLLTPMPGQHQK